MAADAPPGKGVHLPGSPVLWIGVLAVVVVGGGYLIWKRNQASSSAAADTSAAPAAGAGTDGDAGQIGTLQSEIGDLQSSQTQEKVQVPNVVGMKQEDAYGAINAAGLHPAGAPVEPGKILYVKAQAPGAGALANKGSTVALQSAVKAAPVPKPKPKPKPIPKKDPNFQPGKVAA